MTFPKAKCNSANIWSYFCPDAGSFIFNLRWDLWPKIPWIGNNRKEIISTVRLRRGYAVDSEDRIRQAGIGSIDWTNEKWFYKEKR